MRKGYGKRKGGRYENEICRVLSEWVTGSRKPAVFRRTSGSGSRHTRSAGVELEAGDIVGITADAQVVSDRYYFECKNYGKVSFKHLLQPGLKTALLPEWAADAAEKASSIGKKPLIIFKAARTPDYIMLRSSEFSDMTAFVGAPRFLSLLWDGWIICLLSDFLNWFAYRNVALLHDWTV